MYLLLDLHKQPIRVKFVLLNSFRHRHYNYIQTHNVCFVCVCVLLREPIFETEKTMNWDLEYTVCYSHIYKIKDKNAICNNDYVCYVSAGLQRIATQSKRETHPIILWNARFQPFCTLFIQNTFPLNNFFRFSTLPVNVVFAQFSPHSHVFMFHCYSYFIK